MVSYTDQQLSTFAGSVPVLHDVSGVKNYSIDVVPDLGHSLNSLILSEGSGLSNIKYSNARIK